MALLDSEVRRCRYELGYNVLSAGADPYIGVHAVFEQVIQTYITTGASTTSSTSVSSATTATPVTLTLASATGFAAGDRVVIDVDARQESAIVQAVSGSTIVVQLTGAHSGTYPVTVEGGESIVRELLRQLYAIGGVGGALETSAQTAGIKKVDEVEFFGDSGTKAVRWAQLQEQREMLRDELASALGVVNLRRYRASSSGVLEVY